MYRPTLEEARDLVGRGDLLPVYREVLADLETPVSAYLKVVGDGKGFLLESVEGGEQLGRYSFIGAGTVGEIVLYDGVAERVTEGRRERLVFDDPLDLLDRLVCRQPIPVPGLPRFQGGAVGYLAYECARYFERLPVPERDPLGMPLGHFLVCDALLVFDHVRRTIKVVSHVPLDGDVARAYQEAVRRIDHVVERLQVPLVEPPRPLPSLSGEVPRASGNVSREQYEAMVRRSKDYVRDGDVIQVVPSQRFTLPVSAHPFAIYRALRVVNPSPYMYYLQLGDYQLVGASPELLVLVENGEVATYPIAGTRRRGATAEEDAALAEELLADEKERAEHVMLVDLGRNDIGRVSEPGSVRVPKLMEIERYSHVMHLVSRVTGRLRPGLRGVDALRACFPAGTVSGAPKIRAMEIIAELEPDRRGPYAGSVGYLGYNGDLEMAITIRTVVLKDGYGHVQAGAGVVADSRPEREYQETVDKATAMLRALQMAEAMEASHAAAHR